MSHTDVLVSSPSPGLSHARNVRTLVAARGMLRRTHRTPRGFIRRKPPRSFAPPPHGAKEVEPFRKARDFAGKKPPCGLCTGNFCLVESALSESGTSRSSSHRRWESWQSRAGGQHTWHVHAHERVANPGPRAWQQRGEGTGRPVWRAHGWFPSRFSHIVSPKFCSGFFSFLFPVAVRYFSTFSPRDALTPNRIRNPCKGERLPFCL